MAKCLYNGKIYPAPPAEWNVTTHPYAYISISAGRAYFKAFDKLGFLKLNDIGYYIYTLGSLTTDENPQYIDALSWWISDDETAWEVSSTSGTSVAHSADRGPVWANKTILYEDGTIAIIGSDPVAITTPQFDSTSHQIGFGLGMSLIGRRIVNIVRMCLYGGTEPLPGPPSWDRGTFPYAAVFKYADCDYKEADYKFVASTAPYLLSTTGDSIVTATQVRRRFWISDDHSHWIDKGQVEQEVEMYLRILELFDGHTVVWTNHDILHVDSTDVYMAATNPEVIAE